MSSGVRVGGAWKALAAAPSVRVGGAWKSVTNMWVRVAGVWKAVPLGPTVVITGSEAEWFDAELWRCRLTYTFGEASSVGIEVDVGEGWLFVYYSNGPTSPTVWALVEAAEASITWRLTGYTEDSGGGVAGPPDTLVVNRPA